MKVKFVEWREKNRERKWASWQKQLRFPTAIYWYVFTHVCKSISTWFVKSLASFPLFPLTLSFSLFHQLNCFIEVLLAAELCNVQMSNRLFIASQRCSALNCSCSPSSSLFSIFFFILPLPPSLSQRTCFSPNRKAHVLQAPPHVSPRSMWLFTVFNKVQRFRSVLLASTRNLCLPISSWRSTLW